MISKFARLLVMCAVLLAVSPLYFPGESLFGPVGPLTYHGAEPMASSPQYKPGQPRIVKQSTVDMQLYGSRVEPTGGAGVKWVWHF